jgi:uncharacterized membrane protein
MIRFLHGFGSIALFVFMAWYFLYRHPAPDYNELLSVLIGTQVTIVTVMFSAVLVALQLASAQFSPRITRLFFRYNAVNQSAFYFFLFGIAFCAAAKFTYQKDLGTFAYPWMPVAGAVYAFFLISGVLPRFVFHIADSINVAAATHAITQRTLQEIDTLYGTTHWQSGDIEYLEKQPTPQGITIRSQKMGFLDNIKTEKINTIAQKWPNWQFDIQAVAGTFISPDEVLLVAAPPDKDTALPTGLAQQLLHCFNIAPFRSYELDISFGVRQLVDIAIKAISPAVNDPTTAINCLHYIGAIVRRQGLVQQPSLAIRQAAPNVILRDFSYRNLVNLAFDQIFQWGKHDPVVLCQILATITDVAHCVRNPHCRAVLRQQVAHFELDRLHFDNAEQTERIQRHRAACEAALA